MLSKQYSVVDDFPVVNVISQVQSSWEQRSGSQLDLQGVQTLMLFTTGEIARACVLVLLASGCGLVAGIPQPVPQNTGRSWVPTRHELPTHQVAVLVYSHHPSVRKCIDIVKRNEKLVTFWTFNFCSGVLEKSVILFLLNNTKFNSVPGTLFENSQDIPAWLLVYVKKGIARSCGICTRETTTRTVFCSVIIIINVQFQKISIPPPRREFQLRPSTSPEFPFL